MLADLYNLGLRAAGVSAVMRRAQDGAVILCYHNVVAKNPGAGGQALHLSCDEFTRQMRWIAGHYSVVSLRELAHRISTGQPLRRVAVVTFDDAYRGVFDHAWPVLRQLKLPATVFVPTALIDLGEVFWWDHPRVTGGATPEQRASMLTEFRGDRQLIADAMYGRSPVTVPDALRPAGWTTIAQAASEGMDLGVHSASHRNLTCVGDDELGAELIDSRSRLFATTGVRADSFAYPYGLFDTRVRAAVKAAGYREALTVDYGVNRANADLWALRRVNIPSSISPAAFDVWLAGLRPQFRRA